MVSLESGLKMKLLSFIVIFTVSHSSYSNEIWEGRVVRVVEGDTAIFERYGNGKFYTIRLAHIDAPEPNQTYSDTVENIFRKLVLWRNCLFIYIKKDYYNRHVGEIFIKLDLNNIYYNVNKTIVALGGAWFYKRCSKDKIYSAVEKIARKAKIGLWGYKNPIPPWKWNTVYQGHCY